MSLGFFNVFVLLKFILVLNVDGKVGDVDERVLDPADVFRIRFRGNPDQAVVINVNGQGIQTRQQNVNAEIKLKMIFENKKISKTMDSLDQTLNPLISRGWWMYS